MYLDLDLDLGYRSGCGEINPREKKQNGTQENTENPAEGGRGQGGINRPGSYYTLYY